MPTKRIASVKEALWTEADFIGIGRPITSADYIMEAIERVFFGASVADQSPRQPGAL